MGIRMIAVAPSTIRPTATIPGETLRAVYWGPTPTPETVRKANFLFRKISRKTMFLKTALELLLQQLHVSD